jgi:hypothetical protein
MKTKIFLGLVLVAIVIIAIGGFYYPQVQNKVIVGSVVGPDNYLPYFAVNDVARVADNKVMAKATTTVYAFKPASTVGATTTLNFASCAFKVSSTTASVVTFAKATSAFATSTVLATSTIAANAQVTVRGATTTPVSDSTNGRATLTDRIFSPSDYLVVSMEGGAGTFSPTGNCISEFIRN